MTQMRSTLGRVRGLGSAKEGVHHWWMQRLTAIGLVLTGLWFVIAALNNFVGADFAQVQAFLASPGNATLMIVFVATLFYHAQLGLQVVIEDYVHDEGSKFFALIVVKFAAVLCAVMCIVSVLQASIGS